MPWPKVCDAICSLKVKSSMAHSIPVSSQLVELIWEVKWYVCVLLPISIVNGSVWAVEVKEWSLLCNVSRPQLVKGDQT